MRDKQVAGCLSQINCVTVGGIISVPRPSSIVSLSSVLETQEEWLRLNPTKTPQDWMNYIQKFFLSPKAAKGILRRAERRGKDLPEMLHRALLQVAEGQSERERAEDKTRLSPKDSPAQVGAGGEKDCQPKQRGNGKTAETDLSQPLPPFKEWIEDTKDLGGTREEWEYLKTMEKRNVLDPLPPLPTVSQRTNGPKSS